MENRNLPPHNSEAEEAVLGSVLLDREVVARLSTTLVPSDFYHERHGIIWTAMLALYERDEPVDYLTLIEELDRVQRLQMVGGTTYVANLLGVVPTPINAAEYARIVTGAAAHRRLISVASKVAGIGFKAEGSPEDSVRRSEQLLASVLRTEQAADFVKMDDASAEYMQELNAKEQARLAGLTGTTYAIPTGYRDIDRALQGGLGRSDLIVMAGRPGMGKSGIAMEFARRAALGWGVGVAVFSLEMATNQLVARMFSVDSGIPLSALRRAEVQQRDAAALGASYSRLQKARIWFDDSSSPTVEQVRSRVRRLARTESIDLVIIDHIQILAGSQRGVNRVQELTEISRALKALAKDENIAVLALSQLSRAVDHRPDKRPNLSDLRESGSIEQDSDVVLLLYRDGYYNEDSERRDQLEVIVAKHRNGPTGTEVLFWAPQTTGFLGTEAFGL